MLTDSPVKTQRRTSKIKGNTGRTRGGALHPTSRTPPRSPYVSASFSWQVEFPQIVRAKQSPRSPYGLVRDTGSTSCLVDETSSCETETEADGTTVDWQTLHDRNETLDVSAVGKKTCAPLSCPFCTLSIQGTLRLLRQLFLPL